MKTIELSDEVHAALQDLAKGFRRTPDDVLAVLLNVTSGSPDAGEPLAAFILGTDFRSKVTDSEKYLALLSWLAARHASEFAEFIRGLDSGRRYLSFTREQIVSVCRAHQAQQIAGTPYWAIMNLDAVTKQRFLARVLEFAGYRDVLIEFACAAIGPKRLLPRHQPLALVA